MHQMDKNQFVSRAPPKPARTGIELLALFFNAMNLRSLTRPQAGTESKAEGRVNGGMELSYQR